MSSDTCEIVVIGAGLSGLIATSTLGRLGVDVICCDEKEPANTCLDDNRVTAFLGSSIDLLKEAVDWQSIRRQARPLQNMRIVDSSADHDSQSFCSDMIGEKQFGFALPNHILIEALKKQISSFPNTKIRSSAKMVRQLPRLSEIIITLEGDETHHIRADLAVAADGGNSALRSLAGITTRRFGFHQKSLSFNVAHSEPHGDETVEIYAAGGPFTLVPIDNTGESFASSCVWMANNSEAQRLMSLSDDDFVAEANRRSLGQRGTLRLTGVRKMWPAFAQLADRFIAERVVLVGEAAHMVPPIGAQGMNMTMADIAELRRLVLDGRDHLAAPQMLSRYHQSRYGAVLTRMTAIMALNWMSAIDNGAIHQIRQKGLSFLAKTPFLRNPLMRRGMWQFEMTHLN